jgi:hypothetical protein
VLLLPLFHAAAQKPDATFIMNRSRELSLSGSMGADVTLTITEKNGTSRMRTISMTTKTYNDGLEKRFIKFIEPPDVKGTAMLVIDNRNTPDEMWIFLPALKKTRRIVTSEKGKSFMSSEFSNADMSSPTISDFTNRHLEQSGSGHQWIIESKPVSREKSDEYGYSRKLSYVDLNSYRILKMEFYNFDNELFKTIEIKNVHPLSEGKYIVQNMVANNIITGRRSQIVLTNIKDDLKIEDTFFTIQNLQR